MTELFVDTDSHGRPLLNYRHLIGMPYVMHQGTEYERPTKIIGRSLVEPESKVVAVDELGKRHAVPGQLVIAQLEAKGVKLSLVRRFWALPITQRQILRALAYEPVEELSHEYSLSHNIDTEEANGSLEKIILEQDDLVERGPDGALTVRDAFLLRWIRATHGRAEPRLAPTPAVTSEEEAQAIFARLGEEEGSLLMAIAIEPISELDENYCEDHGIELGQSVSALERLRAGGRLLDADVDDRVVIRGPLMKKWVRAKAMAARRDLEGAEVGPREMFDICGAVDLAILRALAYDPPQKVDERWCRRHDLPGSVDQTRGSVDDLSRRKPPFVRRNSGKRLVVGNRESRIFLRSTLRRARAGLRIGSLTEYRAARLAHTLARDELAVLHALAWDPTPRLSDDYCRLHDLDPERAPRSLGIAMADFGLVDRNAEGVLAMDPVAQAIIRRIIPRPRSRVTERVAKPSEQVALLLVPATATGPAPAAVPKPVTLPRPRAMREQLTLVNELVAPARSGEEVEL
ncbi:MAG: hypothetical protein ACYDGR_07195 [Candidatus Dormibacteria bacterium]